MVLKASVLTVLMVPDAWSGRRDRRQPGRDRSADREARRVGVRRTAAATAAEAFELQDAQQLFGSRPRRTASGAARQWILDELKRTSPKLQVSFDTHMVQTVRGCAGPIEFRNVMAVLPGKSARRIYVSGHYDTLNLGCRRPADE